MATLASLRQVVGDRLGIHTVSTVTAVGVKGLVSFIDTTVTDPDDSLRGSWVSLGSQGYIGQVAGNRAGEITLRTPLPSAPAVSDPYDLYRRFSPKQLNQAINYALSQSYPLLYAKLEIEVAEDSATLEYPYPNVTSPTVSGTKTGAGSGTTFDYAVISRTGAGDSVLGNIFSADFVTPDATHFVTLTWPSNGSDKYLVIRRVNAGAWFLFAVLNGSVLTYVDKNQDQGGSTAYTFNTVPPMLLNLRQMRRRSNPGQTPPTYVELPGGLWEDLGSSVRIRYRPSTGQSLLFVGLAQPIELVADTDSTPVDSEVVVTGAAFNLYSLLAEGQGLSNNSYALQQAAYWAKLYDAAKKSLAMPSIPYETHPPYSRVVTAPQTLVGPINP